VREQFPINRKYIDLNEKAFFEWWKKVQGREHRYTLRMAFDAGYEAAMREKKSE
jgi:hypothetical protein